MTLSVKMAARVPKTIQADLTASVPVDLSDLTVRKVSKLCDKEFRCHK